MPPVAYELESLNEEVKKLLLKKGILPKQVSRLQSNQIFQHGDLL